MDSSGLFSHPYEQSDTPASGNSDDRVQAPVFSDHVRNTSPSDTRSS
jgi:hypothetical protein